MILKFIVTPIIITLLIQAWAEFKKSRLGLFWFIFWSLAWTSVIIILFFPQITTTFANFLGIGRGVDAIIYLSIVGLFYLTFRIYLKIEILNKKISLLSQKQALSNHEKS